jgi:hypothetical protein
MRLVSDVPGDFEGDRDVDAADFDAFYRRLTGSNQAILPGCESQDMDGESDVGLTDLGCFP